MTGAAFLDPALSLNDFTTVLIDFTAVLADLLNRRSAQVLGEVVASHYAQCTLLSSSIGIALWSWIGS